LDIAEEGCFLILTSLLYIYQQFSFCIAFGSHHQANKSHVSPKKKKKKKKEKRIN